MKGEGGQTRHLANALSSTGPGGSEALRGCQQIGAALGEPTASTLPAKAGGSVRLEQS